MLVHWNFQAMTWTAAEVWCSSWLAGCSSWEGAQAQLKHEHVLLSGGFFPTKKRPRHVQRQHCACETPTMLQEESAIGFTFSLSVCTSQSNTLSFNDSQRYFLLLSSHEKQTKKPVKPRAFSFPPAISAKSIHQSALQKLSTVPADFSLPQCCNT